jgi:hypothetical protein
VLERRAQAALNHLEPGKRIGWVGGAYAHLNLRDMPNGEVPVSTPADSAGTASRPASELQEAISRVEREVFDPDAEAAELWAQRKMRVESHSSKGAD